MRSFVELVGALTAPFADDPLKARTVPEVFAHNVVPQASGDLELRTTILERPGRFELRIAHFRSPKIDIVAAFAFPEPQHALPVIGLEAVTLGPNPVVGLLDAVELHGSAPAPFGPLPALRDANADLGRSEDQPDWFVECRSGAEIFVRPEDPRALERIIGLGIDLFGALAAIDPAAPLVADGDRHAAALRHYKDHHRENAPGLPLMRSRFGEDWTERFTRDYFFL